MGCLTIETWLLFITNVFGLSLYFLYFCLYHLECYFMKEIKLETKSGFIFLPELPEEESRLMEAAIKSDGTIVCPLFEVSCRSGSFAGGRHDHNRQ